MGVLLEHRDFVRARDLACGSARPLSGSNRVAVAIHGGAGEMEEARLPAEIRAQYLQTLEDVVGTAHDFLLEGGGAGQAVQLAVVLLEESPLFNAGRGAVLRSDRSIHLDASYMEGWRGHYGAVSNLTSTRNPILFAGMLADRERRLQLVGERADEFGRDLGAEQADLSFFMTEHRRAQFERVRNENVTTLDHQGLFESEDKKHGTVGAVAVDVSGRLAAGTSTGGTVNSDPGRAGDSGVIGCGTWADGNVAISCTGRGELFIERAVAHEAAMRVRFLGETGADAGLHTIHSLENGAGGLILVDREANFSWPRNTRSMFRAGIDGSGHTLIGIEGENPFAR